MATTRHNFRFLKLTVNGLFKFEYFRAAALIIAPIFNDENVHKGHIMSSYIDVNAYFMRNPSDVRIIILTEIGTVILIITTINGLELLPW